jgi:hypothetical protein
MTSVVASLLNLIIGIILLLLAVFFIHKFGSRKIKVFVVKYIRFCDRYFMGHLSYPLLILFLIVISVSIIIINP